MERPADNGDASALARVRALERRLEERAGERAVIEGRIAAAHNRAEALAAVARERGEAEGRRRREEIMGAAQREADELRAAAERDAALLARAAEASRERVVEEAWEAIVLNRPRARGEVEGEREVTRC